MATAAVHSIDHFALNLPDLAGGERFISTVGLSFERLDAELRLRAIGNEATLAGIKQAGLDDADVRAIERRECCSTLRPHRSNWNPHPQMI